MTDSINLLLILFALPAALYFLLLLAVGFFSRLAFDAIAVLSFLLLLMAWLAGSGLKALFLFVMVCAHTAITAFAHSQLRRMEHSYRHWARLQTDGGD